MKERGNITGVSNASVCILTELARPVLATCGIRRPALACEDTSCCLLLLADSPEEEDNLKH
jgi:hypothetical protein